LFQNNRFHCIENNTNTNEASLILLEMNFFIILQQLGHRDMLRLTHALGAFNKRSS